MFIWIFSGNDGHADRWQEMASLIINPCYFHLFTGMIRTDSAGILRHFKQKTNAVLCLGRECEFVFARNMLTLTPGNND